MTQILFIIFLLIVGYILKFCKMPQNFAQSLNSFVIFVSLPATILVQLPKIKFDSSFILPALMPWFVAFLSVIFTLIFFKNVPSNTKAALLLLLPLSNTSFFGFPMLEATLGLESIKYAIIYDQFGTFLILAIYGSFVIAYFEGKSVKPIEISKKIAFFPPFIFLILAFFITIPDDFVPYLTILSKTLVPLALISVGYSMQLNLGEEKIIFAKAILLKLFVIPMIILGLFMVIGINDLSAKTILLESAMPPMITAGALAISAGFAPRLSAALVGYGILFGIVSCVFFDYIF